VEFTEIIVITATSLVAVGCARAAARFTYRTEKSAPAEASISSDEASRAPETFRFAGMFQGRRFSMFFLLAVLLGTGISAHFIYTNTVNYIDFIKISVVYMAGLMSMIIDLKYHRIPNSIPLFLLAGRALTIGYEFLFRKDVAVNQLISSALGFAVCFVVLFALSKAMHNGIGMGDVKFLSAIGFMLGIYAVCSILLMGLLASCVISIILLITKVKKVKDFIPFAPFIYIGMICTIVMGTF